MRVCLLIYYILNYPKIEFDDIHRGQTYAELSPMELVRENHQV